MRNGSFVVEPTSWPISESSFVQIVSAAHDEGVPEAEIDFKKAGSTLHSVAILWLAQDRRLRAKEEKEGKREKKRGARIAVGSILRFAFASPPLNADGPDGCLGCTN
jgi:CCR4-NOT complex subunit CAF16